MCEYPEQVQKGEVSTLCFGRRDVFATRVETISELLHHLFTDFHVRQLRMDQSGVHEVSLYLWGNYLRVAYLFKRYYRFRDYARIHKTI